MISAKKASITNKTFIWDCVNPFKFLLRRRSLDMFQPVANKRNTALGIVSTGRTLWEEAIFPWGREYVGEDRGRWGRSTASKIRRFQCICQLIPRENAQYGNLAAIVGRRRWVQSTQMQQMVQKQEIATAWKSCWRTMCKYPLWGWVYRTRYWRLWRLSIEVQ